MQTRYRKDIWLLLPVILCSLLFTGCKKFIEIAPPVTSSNVDNVYNTDATAIAVMNAVYSDMTNYKSLPNGESLNSFMTLFPGLSADELTLYNTSSANNLLNYYRNTLNNTSGPNPWLYTYPVIFTVNSVIEGVTKSNSLTPEVKQQLLGEAKFIRAFNFFYLINLYGNVPLVLITDYKVNSSLSRTNESDVYKQIVQDLTESKSLLNDNYVAIDGQTSSSERIVPNKWAATALLARVYLYIKDYKNAEIQSSEVINYTELYDTVPLPEVFLKNNKEAIWQLQPVNQGWNSEDAKAFVIPSTGFDNDHPVYLNNELINSFEPGDKRKTIWTNKYTDTVPNPDIDYYYPYKYKSAVKDDPINEYHTVLRLGEQYLIRAESRVQQNKLLDGLSDLNIIRNRAGLPEYSETIDESSLMNAIIKERRFEFFAEWGHRWLDLKRLNLIDQVMTVASVSKGSTWNSDWKWYPIPLSEIKSDLHLEQNKGY